MSEIKAGKQEFTVEGACFECMYLGWCAFNDDSEIQRCDNCAVFADDDAALAYALRLAAKALKSGRRRSGKRFKQVLLAVEIAAERISPAFWLGKPSPDWIRQTVTRLKKDTGDTTTTLQIAYEMQEVGLIHCPTNGEDVEADNEYVREYMDRDEIERMLSKAGCYRDEVHEAYGWRVKEGKAA